MQSPRQQTPRPDAKREERVAAALRENLRKRKAQLQERACKVDPNKEENNARHARSLDTQDAVAVATSRRDGAEQSRQIIK